jgi:hypothetical protein
MQNRWNDLGHDNTFPRSYVIEWPSPIVLQPMGAIACPLGGAPFSIQVPDSGSFSYQWQIQDSDGSWLDLSNQPVSLSCGGVAFASSANLPGTDVFLRTCSNESQYQIRCVLSDNCDSISSAAATYTICPVDFDCSGTLNSQDFFGYLSVFFLGAATADFNEDGIVNSQDFFSFLAAFFAGC